MIADFAVGALEFLLDMLPWTGSTRNAHERMHPRYGIPRERVRAMKRTGQGRAELKRIRDR